MTDKAPDVPSHRRQLLAAHGFPALVVLLLVVFTAAGISGSSASVLSDYLGKHSSNTVVGDVRSVRSDEWLVNTPFIVGQAAAGNPETNPHLVGGTDTTLILDAPYKGVSVLLRPQLWSFFVLPLDQAFAFHWWLLEALALIALYYLVLELRPGRRVLAIAIAIGLTFSPLVQWWYTTTTIGTVAYGSALGLAFFRAARADSVRLRVLWAGAIAWFSGCFALALYPPYQVPVAGVIAALCVGHLISGVNVGQRRRALVTAAAGLAGGGVLVGAFFLKHHDTVKAITGSVYPGHRVIPTGQFHVSFLLSGFLDAGLRSDAANQPGALAAFNSNQSEASGFVLAGIGLLVLHALLLAAALVQRRKLDWRLLLFDIACVVFLAVLFVRHVSFIAHLTGLSSVPHERVQMGVGLWSWLAIPVTAASPLWETTPKVVRRVAGGGVAVGTVLVFSVITVHVHRASTALSGSYARAIPTLVVLLIAATLLLLGRFTEGAVVAALLTIWAGGLVHPIVHGVYDVRDQPVGKAVLALDAREPGTWISLSGFTSNPILTETGVDTLSTVQTYPHDSAWEALGLPASDKTFWNRYAHVAFTEDPRAPEATNPSPDQMTVHIDLCDPTVQAHVRHVIARDPVASPCAAQVQAVVDGGFTWTLYDLAPPTARKQ